MLTGQFSIPQ